MTEMFVLPLASPISETEEIHPAQAPLLCILKQLFIPHCPIQGSIFAEILHPLEKYQDFREELVWFCPHLFHVQKECKGENPPGKGGF